MAIEPVNSKGLAERCGFERDGKRLGAHKVKYLVQPDGSNDAEQTNAGNVAPGPERGECWSCVPRKTSMRGKAHTPQRQNTLKLRKTGEPPEKERKGKHRIHQGKSKSEGEGSERKAEEPEDSCHDEGRQALGPQDGAEYGLLDEEENEGKHRHAAVPNLFVPSH